MTGASPHVVVIATQKIGDVLVSTPAVRNLRRGLPGAHVTLVCRPATRHVLAGWDAVDGIVEFDHRWPHERQAAMIDDLRSARIELVLNVTSEWNAYWLTRRLRGRRRAGVIYGANLLESVLARVFLTDPVRVRVSEASPPRGPVRHRVEELLLVNRRLGLPADALPLEVPIDEAADRRAAEVLDPWRASGPPVVLHLGTKWLQYGWRGADLAGLVEALERVASPRLLVVTAGPEDDDVAAALVECLPFEAAGRWHDGDPAGPSARQARRGRVLLLQSLSFHAWAALLARARLAVTPDTGAVHLASATRTPVVAVYAPRRFHVVSRQWGPWMVPHRALLAERTGDTNSAIETEAANLLDETEAWAPGPPEGGPRGHCARRAVPGEW